MIYAIADLHGRYDLLDHALQRITEHDYDLGKPGGKVVFLGDYVDRGPQSREIIERLMAGPEAESGFEWICLQGNHEVIMLTALADPASAYKWWAGNGGVQTLVSYGAKNGDRIDQSLARVPANHFNWLNELPLAHIEEHYAFVHGSLKDGVSIGEQDSEYVQWHLHGRAETNGWFGKHVVHGHEQFEDGPIRHPLRTDLDTLAWCTGRLVVGVFEEDVAGGPVELLEVQGPTHQELSENMRAAA
jgi:serine/threonine protein phosphatase 1